MTVQEPTTVTVPTPTGTDGLVAAAVLVVGLATVLAAEQRPTWPLLLALTVVLALALAWRRAAPAAVALVVASATLGIWIVGEVDGPTALAGGIALYSLGRYSPRPLSVRVITVVALVLGGYAVGEVVLGGWSHAFQALARIGLILATFWMGDAAQSRAALTATLRERADRAERERSALAREAVLAERARISRDLHDVVAHSVAVIVVQADVAERLADSDPAASRSAIHAVADTARSTLTEMRSVVGRVDALGEEADGSDPHDASAGARRGEADIEALVAGFISAGLAVELQQEGEAGSVPELVSSAVYRIVQESLTNVLKHAGTQARAQVALHWGSSADAAVEATISHGATPALAARPAPGSRRGIPGMRERALALGGSLEAGLTEGGGFRVRAILPRELRAMDEEEAG